MTMRGLPAAGMVLLSALLGACSIAPPREPPAAAAEQLWQERLQQLQRIEAWTFNGRAGISGADIPSRTVRIHWQQGRDRYELGLMSLIGQRVAELSGDDAAAELRLPGEAPVSAANAGDLLIAAVGWSAPVESLRYWVLGLPHPLTPDARLELDPWGRLQRLDQGGWVVEITQYLTSGGFELPRRLTLTGHELRIRLIIDNWELERPDANG